MLLYIPDSDGNFHTVHCPGSKHAIIVLFKSLRNFNRVNKGKFYVEIKLKQDNVVWGWGATLSFFLNKMLT